MLSEAQYRLLILDIDTTINAKPNRRQKKIKLKLNHY